jgi:hypothetical protein
MSHIIVNLSQARTPTEELVQNWGDVGGAGGDAGTRRRMRKQYLSYFAEPRGFGAGPTSVNLRGRNGKRRNGNGHGPTWDGYELNFFQKKQPDSVRQVVRRAVTRGTLLLATVSTILSPGYGWSPDERITPPAMDGGNPEGITPPINKLTLAATNKLPALLDDQGRPIHLAAFHTNTPVVHSNADFVHTNVWNNHSNVITPHVNNWANHSNVPTYTIPHTNIVPGDFIF